MVQGVVDEMPAMAYSVRVEGQAGDGGAPERVQTVRDSTPAGGSYQSDAGRALRTSTMAGAAAESPTSSGWGAPDGSPIQTTTVCRGL